MKKTIKMTNLFFQLFGNRMGSASADGSMRVAFVQITPALANELLKYNTLNRKLRMAVYKRYVHDMLVGQWFHSESCICIGLIGGKEVLLNGQHRLKAIIESGKTIENVVLYGLSKESYDVMDNGQARKAEDYLVDISQPSKKVPLAGLYYAMHNGASSIKACMSSRMKRDSESYTNCTRSDKVNIVREHDEELGDYVEFGEKMSKGTYDRHSSHYAMAMMFIDALGDKGVRDAFIRDFQSLDAPTTVVRKARELITNYKKGLTTQMPQRDYNVGVMLTAYSLYEQGKQDASEALVYRRLNELQSNYDEWNGRLEKLRAASHKATAPSKPHSAAKKSVPAA